jgi:hypothetical protein
VLKLLQVSYKCLRKVFSMMSTKIMYRNVFYTGKSGYFCEVCIGTVPTIRSGPLFFYRNRQSIWWALRICPKWRACHPGFHYHHLRIKFSRWVKLHVRNYFLYYGNAVTPRWYVMKFVWDKIMLRMFLWSKVMSEFSDKNSERKTLYIWIKIAYGNTRTVNKIRFRHTPIMPFVSNALVWLKWCAQCCPTAESYEKLMSQWSSEQESAVDVWNNLCSVFVTVELNSSEV